MSNRWIQVDFNNLVVVLALIFFAVLLWNVTVVNHRKNIERDQYMVTHCKSVDFGAYGGPECDNNTRTKFDL